MRLKDNGYYTGLSQDPEKRLITHNQSGVRSTKNRKPFRLIHTEKFDTRSEAREREKHLKSYKGSKEKLDIIDKTK